ETERKFYQNSSKSWLSVVRSMETRGKKQLLPSNANLYHYAANNPVKYTDPDGRKIVPDVITNKNAYKIINSMLKIIKCNNTKSPELTELKEMITKLENCDQVIKISVLPGEGENQTIADEMGKSEGSGSRIIFYYESRKGGIDDEGNTDRDPIVGLVHELGHAEAFAEKNYDTNKGDRTPGTTPSGEKNSLKRENQMRKVLKIPLRSFYYQKEEVLNK
ncbi:hypothetical protein, partial [Treponema sp.]|uniref:hypothetical protein n=1 Tax=Treponema sp. TaxID=166 RepID=UPI00388D8307